jgi:hypothetical protein
MLRYTCTCRRGQQFLWSALPHCTCMLGSNLVVRAHTLHRHISKQKMLQAARYAFVFVGTVVHCWLGLWLAWLDC